MATGPVSPASVSRTSPSKVATVIRVTSGNFMEMFDVFLFDRRPYADIRQDADRRVVIVVPLRELQRCDGGGADRDHAVPNAVMPG